MKSHCEFPTTHLILFLPFHVGNHTANPLYGTVLHAHEQKNCILHCLSQVACVTMTSDDAVYRTRGDRSRCVSHATAAKPVAQYCYCLCSSFKTVFTNQFTKCQAFPRVGDHLLDQLQHSVLYQSIYCCVFSCC